MSRKGTTKAQSREALAAAGITVNIHTMSPERLQARLSQRATRIPNKKALASRKACRGGQW